MDFDLSQAVDGPKDSKEDPTESRCFNMKEVEEEIIRIDKGLELVVTHNNRTMKGVANLVLAVNRLKNTQPRSDEELCSAIMESLVEETVVETIVNPCTGLTDRVFLRSNSHTECTLCDDKQKAVILRKDLKLEAITLRGGYNNCKVNFKLFKYKTSIGGNCVTVVLSIKHMSNLHISCLMQGDNAILTLEECVEDSLYHIRNDGDLERFLFFKRGDGLSHMFESVKHPGWFISTSPDKDYEPLQMCKQATVFRIEDR